MKTNRRNNNNRNRFSIVIPILTIIGIGIFILSSSSYEKNWSFNWDGIRHEIKDSIRIAESYPITSGFGGLGFSTKNEVNSRSWIMKNATEFELQRLIEYPNGNVKTIAYEGLLRKKDYLKKTELILRAIIDTTYSLDYQSGCIGWNREIGEYLVQDVLMIDGQVPAYPTKMKTTFGISELDKEKILIELKKRSK